MTKLTFGWLIFAALVLTAIFTIKVTEDQYPGYTSMVSKGIAKDHANKKDQKKSGTNDLDLSKYRPKFNPQSE